MAADTFAAICRLAPRGLQAQRLRACGLSDGAVASGKRVETLLKTVTWRAPARAGDEIRQLPSFAHARLRCSRRPPAGPDWLNEVAMRAIPSSPRSGRARQGLEPTGRRLYGSAPRHRLRGWLRSLSYRWGERAKLIAGILVQTDRF